MIRDDYLSRLTDEAYVELYLSANDGARLDWPWRMQPPKEATQSYRDACDTYVMDSDPLDPDVTTRDVLDSAVQYNADVASLADVYQDKDGTVDSLLKGMEIADDHTFGGTLLLPLQQPYAECYAEIGEPTDHWIGLGGLKDSTGPSRIWETINFRNYAGYDVHVHGFGWGPGDVLVHELQRNPSLLDSLDYSSPVQSAMDGTITPGDERMSVVASRSAARLVEDLRKLSPHVTMDTSETVLPPSETTLEDHA